jgi:hypothetical protein
MRVNFLQQLDSGHAHPGLGAFQAKQAEEKV